MRSQQAFTMVELLVIVAIISIVGGILTPMVIKEVGKSKVTRASADMEAVSVAFAQYYLDTGFWPEKYTGAENRSVAFENFGALYQNTENLEGWDGPYMEKGAFKAGKMIVANKVGGAWEGVVDPWGNPFRIIFGKVGGDTAAGGIVLVCTGPDRLFNTNESNVLRGTATGDDFIEVLTSRVREASRISPDAIILRRPPRNVKMSRSGN